MKHVSNPSCRKKETQEDTIVALDGSTLHLGEGVIGAGKTSPHIGNGFATFHELFFMNPAMNPSVLIGVTTIYRPSNLLGFLGDKTICDGQ